MQNDFENYVRNKMSMAISECFNTEDKYGDMDKMYIPQQFAETLTKLIVDDIAKTADWHFVRHMFYTGDNIRQELFSPK
jgi:hypothetical protein